MAQANSTQGSALACWGAALALSGCAMQAPMAGSGRMADCAPANPADIAARLDSWNAALASGDALRVAAFYAPGAVLLPEEANQPRRGATEKVHYLAQWLQERPWVRVERRTIRVGCATAVDTGQYTVGSERSGALQVALYTFTYSLDGRGWLISSHHAWPLATHR
ncbi:MAG TPA: DUF4440 domain-containing protein [Ramlibacter sp.]|nr:DUF4440 domain-containing protein [Ramlibacter sp.]